MTAPDATREAALRKRDTLDAHELAEVWALVDALRFERDSERGRAVLMHAALRNVLALARSDVRRVAPHLADRLVRFCREGLGASILRGAP